MTDTRTIKFTYGDVTVPVQVPLPNNFKYAKGQQALVDFAVEQGWELDVTAISNTYGRRFDSLPAERRAEYLKQHPFKFVKPGKDGGTWGLTLDYVSREETWSWYGSRGFSNTLKGAKLTFTAADGALNNFDAALSGYANYGTMRDTEIVLQPTSRASYASNNWVWDAALVGEGYSLRERVQVLLTDPEAVVERAVALMAESRRREQERQAEQDRIRELKNRPLPAGWSLLQEVAAQVAAADGITDTGALLADLEAAIRGVER